MKNTTTSSEKIYFGIGILQQKRLKILMLSVDSLKLMKICSRCTHSLSDFARVFHPYLIKCKHNDYVLYNIYNTHIIILNYFQEHHKVLSFKIHPHPHRKKKWIDNDT